MNIELIKFFPIMLILFNLIIKLSVNRKFTLIDIVESFFRLPADLMFLSTTMIMSSIFTFSKLMTIENLTLEISNKICKAEFLSLIYIIIMIFSTILWRFSQDFYENQKKRTAISITCFNSALSIFFIIYTINFLRR